MKSKLIFAVLIGLCVTLTNCNTPQEDDEYEYVPEFIQITERRGALCVEPNPFDAFDSVLGFNEYPDISDYGQKSYEKDAFRASETVKFILLNNEGKPISVFDSVGVRMDTIVTYWDFYDWYGNYLDTVFYVHFYPYLDYAYDYDKLMEDNFNSHIFRDVKMRVYFLSPWESLIDSLPCPSPNGPIHAIQKPLLIFAIDKLMN